MANHIVNKNNVISLIMMVAVNKAIGNMMIMIGNILHLRNAMYLPERLISFGCFHISLSFRYFYLYYFLFVGSTSFFFSTANFLIQVVHWMEVLESPLL